MDGGILLLLTATLTIMLLLIQRSERKRRRLVLISMLFLGVAVLWYVNLRGSFGEALVGLILAVVLNLLFWLFVGRYNPVGSSDSIKVLGMDD